MVIRRSAPLLVVAFVAGCASIIGVDEDYVRDDSVVGGGASTTSTGGGTGGTQAGTGGTQAGVGGSATGTQSGTPTGGVACGNTGDPGEGSCPAACDGCQNGVCIISCASPFTCSSIVSCPAGWPCAVTCSDSGCEEANVVCPPNHACTVTCGGGFGDSCRDATITCPDDATCDVTCGGDDDCRDTTIVCGEADCKAICVPGREKPDLTSCSESCACTGC